MTSRSEEGFPVRGELPPVHYGRGPGKSVAQQTLMLRRINERIVELHNAGPLSPDDAEALQELHEMQAELLGGVARSARGLIVQNTHRRKMPSGKVEILSREEYRALRALERGAKRRKRVKVRDMVVGTGLERKPKRQRRARLNGVLLALLALLVVGCVRMGTFPGATPADRAACRMKARELSCDGTGGLVCDAAKTRHYNDCMMSRGFSRAEDPQDPAPPKHRRSR